jgi:hypothetical protein
MPGVTGKGRNEREQRGVEALLGDKDEMRQLIAMAEQIDKQALFI